MHVKICVCVRLPRCGHQVCSIGMPASCRSYVHAYNEHAKHDLYGHEDHLALCMWEQKHQDRCAGHAQRSVPDLVSHRGVIACPEAAAKQLHPHDGEDQEEEAHHNGDVGHGSQRQRDRPEDQHHAGTPCQGSAAGLV